VADLAADGRWAIVGGHNLWHEDYLSFAPVHDVSALVEGRAAGEAHVFLDTLWDWVGGQLTNPNGDAKVHAIRWSEGRTEAAPPPPRVLLPPMPAGRISALALGRLGIGVLPDPRLANTAAAVTAIAFRQARRTIRISQMDFARFFEGVNYWQADVVAAIADVLTDPERAVEVSLVLSEHGAKTMSGGPYSFGTKPADVVAEIRRAIGDRPVTGRMRLAPLRISPQGEGWSHAGRSLAFANHAKVWIVDDHAFHVGSDNLYLHFLQDFGYLFESESPTGDLVRDYWTPLWEHSARASMDVV
jgi:phosphatidylserine/phosphatidylglycerophosphate/cardiolipin synthase-like enzyme